MATAATGPVSAPAGAVLEPPEKPFNFARAHISLRNDQGHHANKTVDVNDLTCRLSSDHRSHTSSGGAGRGSCTFRAHQRAANPIVAAGNTTLNRYEKSRPKPSSVRTRSNASTGQRQTDT